MASQGDAIERRLGLNAREWLRLKGGLGSTPRRRVLSPPDVREKMTHLGLDVAPGSPKSLAGLIQSETAKWAKVVKASGAKLD